WWRGINICGDAGTYLYYGHHPFLDAFKHTRFHNTITIDQKDQMERMHRFTWGYWHDCQLNSYNSEKAIQAFEVEHYGYHRLEDPVTHRRVILCTDKDHWIVIDDILGTKEHEVQLHWRLVNFPVQVNQEQLEIATPKGELAMGIYGKDISKNDFYLKKGRDKNELETWKSDYYGYKESTNSLNILQNKRLPIRLITCFGAAGWSLSVDKSMQQLIVQDDKFSLKLTLGKIGERDIIRSHI
ncbi:MAG: heparinase II/III-family protein, partial [Bacteroidota bacterium]